MFVPGGWSHLLPPEKERNRVQRPPPPLHTHTLLPTIFKGIDSKFLREIDLCDYTWVYLYEPENKENKIHVVWVSETDESSQIVRRS